MLQKLYKLTFWSGYTAVLVTSVLNLKWKLDEKHVRLLFDLRLDHLLHFGAYFLIGMYYLLGQRMGLSLFRQHSMRTFLILTLLLASVTEVVQLWVPARAFNPFDWVANVAGIGMGVIIITVIDGKRKKEDMEEANGE
jgi:VanZ family protein